VRLDFTSVFSITMVWVIEGNEGLSALPVPSTAKLRPPSSDTVTRGSALGAGLAGVLRPDDRLVDRADKRSENGDCERGGDREVLGTGEPLAATFRRCSWPLWWWTSSAAGNERPHGSQWKTSWLYGHRLLTHVAPCNVVAQ
jgi:hypothetical protein